MSPPRTAAAVRNSQRSREANTRPDCSSRTWLRVADSSSLSRPRPSMAAAAAGLGASTWVIQGERRGPAAPRIVSGRDRLPVGGEVLGRVDHVAEAGHPPVGPEGPQVDLLVLQA